MRRKSEAVLTFAWNNDRLPKSVLDWREKYKRISRILDDHPEVLDWVHEDRKKLSQKGNQGREGDFTSETILRALVVHAIQGESLRETVLRIADSEFLQDFLRTRKRAFAQRPADCTLTGEVIERHEKLFGQRPGNRSRGLSRFSRRSPRKWDCPPRQTRGQAHFSGRNGPKNEPVPGL
jgi:hypothetical protein